MGADILNFPGYERRILHPSLNGEAELTVRALAISLDIDVTKALTGLLASVGDVDVQSIVE